MPSRTARLSKKGCGFATPECRAQRDVAVHPRPAPPPPLLAAPRLSTTALGYLEIRWVVRNDRSRGGFERLWITGINAEKQCFQDGTRRVGCTLEGNISGT